MPMKDKKDTGLSRRGRATMSYEYEVEFVEELPVLSASSEYITRLATSVDTEIIPLVPVDDTGFTWSSTATTKFRKDGAALKCFGYCSYQVKCYKCHKPGTVAFERMIRYHNGEFPSAPAESGSVDTGLATSVHTFNATLHIPRESPSPPPRESPPPPPRESPPPPPRRSTVSDLSRRRRGAFGKALGLRSTKKTSYQLPSSSGTRYLETTKETEVAKRNWWEDTQERKAPLVPKEYIQDYQAMNGPGPVTAISRPMGQLPLCTCAEGLLRAAGATMSISDVYNKQLSFSIAGLQKKAVLDRLLGVSLIFQQQHQQHQQRSAGRGAATYSSTSGTSSSISGSRSTIPGALDLKKAGGGGGPSTSVTLIARRLAVQKLATQFPLSSSKALHNARRLQFFGRNRNRGSTQQQSLNLLRFTVLGFGHPTPSSSSLDNGLQHQASSGREYNQDSVPSSASLLSSSPSVILASAMLDEKMGAMDLRTREASLANAIYDRAYPTNEPFQIESLPLSVQEDPCLQDITSWKREPVLEASSFRLDSILDDLEDFQLPASEDSSADHWQLSF
ncbi:hypothetical protein H072_10425 [Dactylellina haptotyla CBS 200.50]|uniref:Uncharacterized protein n=1 Tax=Dactylellina haptotyla (strain CBS 200.50) TaxID=1284197 RepID=S8A012_DACHA|nr:hypothetical protein H072_10425 [Dactylellina haptotyla CBS 200.50]